MVFHVTPAEGHR